MKLGILVCGLCGVISAFIGASSVYAARSAMMMPVVLYIGGFALAAAVGAATLKKPPMKRFHAIVALTGTCLALFYYRGALGDILRLAPLLKEHTAQSILFSAGFYGGVVSAVGAIAKPAAA